MLRCVYVFIRIFNHYDQGEIFNIPSEIFSDVILHLDVNDIGNLSRTCTLLNEVCEDNWIVSIERINHYVSND